MEKAIAKDSTSGTREGAGESPKARAAEGAAPYTPLRLTPLLLWHSFLLSIVSAACAYIWYLSLHRTLVSVNNVLYQSSAVFVYLLSVPILAEPVTVAKVCSVLISAVGLAMVVVSMVSSPSPSPSPSPFPPSPFSPSPSPSSSYLDAPLDAPLDVPLNTPLDATVDTSDALGYVYVQAASVYISLIRW